MNLKIAHDKIFLGAFPRKNLTQGRYLNPWTGEIFWGPPPSAVVIAQATQSVCQADGCTCTQGLRARNAGCYGVLHLCPAHVSVGEGLHADAMAAEREGGTALAQTLKDERAMMR